MAQILGRFPIDRLLPVHQVVSLSLSVDEKIGGIKLRVDAAFIAFAGSCFPAALPAPVQHLSYFHFDVPVPQV